MNAGDYLTKASSNPGAGDILMGFLGSVIISFAFSMFKQRKVTDSSNSNHCMCMILNFFNVGIFSIFPDM